MYRYNSQSDCREAVDVGAFKIEIAQSCFPETIKIHIIKTPHEAIFISNPLQNEAICVNDEQNNENKHIVCWLWLNILYW